MRMPNVTKPTMNLDAALAYAAQGTAVFPCWGTNDSGCACRLGAACENQGKHPIGDLFPNGFKNATCDPETITRWWESYPDANIGGPTGESNGFDVLDVDPRHGGDESWEQLKAAHPELKDIRCPFVVTPSGGNHFYFQHVEGVTNKSGSLPPGIDIRGEGGYVLLPPSTIHGRAYRWGDS